MRGTSFRAEKRLTKISHPGIRAMGIKAEIHLQSYISQMQVQDGLEWRVISGRIQIQDVRQAIAASRVRAGKHLAGAVSNSLSRARIADITAVTRRYEQAVDEEMGMLEQGWMLEATRLDQTRVDPTFAACDQGPS